MDFTAFYICISVISMECSVNFFIQEDIKLPLVLIAGSDLSCNLLIYFIMFLFRNRYDFNYYFLQLMIPELVYTMVITIFLYFIILKINQKLEAIEKRSASKFV